MWIYVSEKSQVTFERPDDLSNTNYIINHTIKCVKRIMRKKWSLLMFICCCSLNLRTL